LHASNSGSGQKEEKNRKWKTKGEPKKKVRWTDSLSQFFRGGWAPTEKCLKGLKNRPAMYSGEDGPPPPIKLQGTNPPRRREQNCNVLGRWETVCMTGVFYLSGRGRGTPGRGGGIFAWCFLDGARLGVKRGRIVTPPLL